MSTFAKPAGFQATAKNERHRKRCAGKVGANCTERVTERGDTWEMSMFNAARKEWAGSDCDRLRQMAAMFLAVACDWEYEAVALALGYANRGIAHNAANAAISAIRRRVKS